MVLLVLYSVSTSACLLAIARCSVHGDISHTVTTHLQYDAKADRLVPIKRPSQKTTSLRTSLSLMMNAELLSGSMKTLCKMPLVM